MQYIKDKPHANIAYIIKALEALNYTYDEIVIDGVTHVRFSKDNEPRWMTTVSPTISYPSTTTAIWQLAWNKSMAYDYVAQMGFRLPLSVTHTIGQPIDIAAALLSKVPKIIVKPEMASLSRGLTLDITTEDQLRTALAAVESDGDTAAIVQEQVYGDEVRFAVIDGIVQGAILRRAARVMGDGTSTVRQLIERENDERRTIAATDVPYPQLDDTIISAQFLSDERVPEAGEIVELAKGTMVRSGASMFDITDAIHPGYKKIAESIANSIPTGFIVIDLMIADYTKSPEESDYWFIEFNTSPVLKLFYSCRDGKHFDAAYHLARFIDRVSTKRSE